MENIIKSCVVKNCNGKRPTHYKKWDIVVCDKHYQHLRTHGKIIERNQFTKNDISCKKGTCTMNLYDRKGTIVAKTLFGDEFLEFVSAQKWSLKSRYGYTRNRKGLMLHRYIWLSEKLSSKKGFVIDHINGNNLDNRLENLRYISHNDNVVLGLLKKDKVAHTWFSNHVNKKYV